MKRNQADLDLFETYLELFPQPDGIHKTAFQPISFRNLNVFLQTMAAWPQLIECLKHRSSLSLKHLNHRQDQKANSHCKNRKPYMC
jgi:hypothetical protein